MDIWHRVRFFNNLSGDNVPDLYAPKNSTDKNSLLGLREELDNIVSRHNLLYEEINFRFYITTRERIEALADIVEERDVNTDI